MTCAAAAGWRVRRLLPITSALRLVCRWAGVHVPCASPPAGRFERGIMRFVGRNDLVLVAGLTLALFVIFSRPLAQLLDYVRQIQETHGLQLLPALVILATIFSFHQLRKGQESRAEAIGSARAAQEATERAEEMGRLVTFG